MSRESRSSSGSTCSKVKPFRSLMCMICFSFTFCLKYSVPRGFSSQSHASLATLTLSFAVLKASLELKSKRKVWARSYFYCCLHSPLSGLIKETEQVPGSRFSASLSGAWDSAAGALPASVISRSLMLVTPVRIWRAASNISADTLISLLMPSGSTFYLLFAPYFLSSSCADWACWSEGL